MGGVVEVLCAVVGVEGDTNGCELTEGVEGAGCGVKDCATKAAGGV